MVKKIILAVNNHRALTLAAIALSIIPAIFGIMNGIWVAVALVLFGAYRQKYKQSNSQGMRWLCLMGIGLAVAIGISSVLALFRDILSSIDIALFLMVAFDSLITTCFLVQLAIEQHQSATNQRIWFLWSAVLGSIGAMLILNYALINHLTGMSASALLQDKFVTICGGISLGLLGIFVLAFLCALLSYAWECLVEWAKK